MTEIQSADDLSDFTRGVLASLLWSADMDLMVTDLHHIAEIVDKHWKNRHAAAAMRHLEAPPPPDDLVEWRVVNGCVAEHCPLHPDPWFTEGGMRTLPPWVCRRCGTSGGTLES